MAEYNLILIRSVGAYIILLIIARIMGKKQLSQLTFFDYIVGITIGSIASSMSVDQNIKITNGIVSLIIWGGLPILTSLIALKSRMFNKLVNGQPTILIENGKILEKNLKKTQLNLGDLMLSLREHNAFKLSDVEFAVLETNGNVSVMKKTAQDPITPQLLNLKLESEHKPETVIQDGKILEKNLKTYGYTKNWLFAEIEKKGATDISDVYAAQIDSKGNLYVDLFDDKVTPPENQERQMVQANLESVIADLESYAIETENPGAKQMYSQQAQEMKQLLFLLKPYLKD